MPNKPWDSAVSAMREFVSPRDVMLLAVMAAILVIARFPPFAGAFQGSANYLSLHAALEIFSVAIAALIFVVGWHAQGQRRNLAILSTLFAGVALLDLAHLLSFPGMPDFVTPSSPDKGIYFWFAARMLAALGLLAAALPSAEEAPRTKLTALVFALAVALGISWIVLLAPQMLPAMFVPGRGLTTAKIGTEAAIIAIHAAAIIGLFVFANKREGASSRYLVIVVCVSALSELCFALYREVSDIYNLFGHLYKLIAYFLLYRGFAVTGVLEPLQRAQRSQQALRRSEERFRGLTELSADWYWEQDEQLRFTFISRARFEHLGGAGSGVLGLRRWELPNLVMTEADWREHREILARHEPFRDFEMHFRSDARGEFWTEVSGFPVHEAGKFLGYRGVGRDITQRKRIERELLDAKHNLQLALAASGAAAWTVDVATGRVDLGEEWSRLLGGEPKPVETTLSQLLDITHPDDRPVLAAASKEMIADGQGLYQEEHRVRTAGGEWLWIRSRGRVVERDAAGRPLRVAGTNVDITDRKRAEMALRESEARFRLLIDHLSVGVVVTDSASRIVLCNPAATRLLGSSEKQLIGGPLFGAQSNLIDADESSLSADRHPVSRVLASGNSLRNEVIGIARPDSKERAWFLVSVEPQISPAGEVMFAICSLTDITAHRRAGLRAHANEARLASVVASAGDAIISVDAQRRIQLFNPAAEKMFGYRFDEVEGRLIEMLIPARFRDVHREHFDSYRESGLTARAMGMASDVKALRRDGMEFSVEASISRFTADQEDTFTVVLRDVTEKRQALDAMTRFRAAMELSGEGIALMDTETLKFMDVNETMCRMSGYSREELLHLGPADMMAGLSPERLRQQIQSGEETFNLAGLLRRRDGGRLPVEVTRRAVALPGGRRLFVSTVRDVTERQRAEAALHESETRYELMVSCIPGMVFQMLQRGMRDNEFVYVSGGSLSLTALTAENIRANANRFFDLIHPEDRPGFEQTLAASAGWGGAWEWEGRLIDARGVQKWINVRAAPRRQEDGVMIWDGIVLNVTQSKLGEERLRQSQEMLRELSAHHETVREEERAGIAREIHDELGQVLTAIKMDLAMLGLKAGATDPELKNKTQEMRGLVDSTIHVVRNIASTLRPAALDLGIVSAVEWLTEEFQKRSGIVCELQVADDELDMDDAHAIVLFRILQESLTNVARHSQAKSVQVDLARRGTRMMLTVRDDGVGFNPQAERTRKSFGLIGIRERVIILGGEVKIDSAVGKGTVVSVSIPC